MTDSRTSGPADPGSGQSEQSSPGHPDPPQPDSTAVGSESQGALQRVVKKLDPLLARTKLDLDACRQVAFGLLANKEAKAKWGPRTAGAPPKPFCPIEDYKNASPCGASWELMSGTDEFRLCNQCKLFVYDFKKMEMADVKKLVFRREGKEEPKYYKRRDGRFLTADCPVGVRGKRVLFFLLVIAILLVVVLIALTSTWSPPPPLASLFSFDDSSVIW